MIPHEHHAIRRVEPLKIGDRVRGVFGLGTVTSNDTGAFGGEAGPVHWVRFDAMPDDVKLCMRLERALP